MSLPPGFEESFGVGKVCKLKKSLHGLKQSPRAWFERFGKVIKHYGYTQSQADHTMFYKHSYEGKVAILIVYVDDIVLTEDDCNELEKLKGKLAEEFEIKDLGALKYFLGMEFARSKEGIFVNQRKYVLDLLDETGMLGCKPVETPIEPNVKLQPTKAKNVKDRDRYQRLVGRLIYLSHTRPDIAFSVSMVSQFMHAPGPEHFEVVYRILRYLKWTLDGNLVTWRSKKQNVVARNSAEAEFRAVAHGICEIMWIRRLLEELKMTGSSPMKLYCDNKAAILVAHNPVLHDCTKHVEMDKHFIKEKIDNGLVCMTYIPTEEQVADVFTKGLHKRQFDFLVGKLAMEDIFKPT
ncbi:Retrovirus-related Pol polyprotein from transposon RE1 [Vitis vinifera]|uniref:Retrovirus-related Pol polyprotein from transposon RE1 n=1 Tax=Vitis vinifera TaxID=29760 RepID=A0A438GW39_VITVI|nr:Retrovirus-related Pol polyprotein from transposon RE1 [Vitis vinifera]